MVHKYKLVIGYDTGIYMHLFTKYTKSEYWPIPPAYPPLESYLRSLRIWMEPGFFTLMSIINKFIGLDTFTLFRYYLPLIISFLFILLGYVAVIKITNSETIALIACLLLSLSYVQYEAINESFYKQIFGTIVLFASLIQLDGFVKTYDKRYLYTLVIIGSSIIAFHRAITFAFGLVLVTYLSYYSVKKDFKCVKWLSLCMVFIVLISSVVWTPLLAKNLQILLDSIRMSLQGMLSIVGKTEDIRYIGGAVPRLLRGSNHILFSYFNTFPYILIFAFIGYIYILKNKIHSSFIILSLILLPYIIFRMNFSNRFILNLDSLFLIIASIGLLNFKFKNTVKIAIITILTIIMLNIALTYQYEISPYIISNEAVKWIKLNIPKQNTIIFAPDSVSVDLMQMGYRVGLYDESLAESRELFAAHFNNEYILTTSCYDIGFLQNHYNLSKINAYFIWISYFERHPLPYTGEKLPTKRYEISDRFEKMYKNNIICIYKLKGGGEM